MTGKRMRWARAKAAKPTQAAADISFPRDELGNAAKSAWLKWLQSLSPKQRRKLRAPQAR